MNATDLASLITAISAAIGTVTGLIILIVHIIRHDPIPGDKPQDSTAKPGMVPPSPLRWDRL